VNPAGIFFSKLYPDTSYFIPFVLDYMKLGRGKTGHHFRIPFVNEKSGYVEIVEVPVELLRVYLPFQKVSYSEGEKKLHKVLLGNEEDISFQLNARENKPQKASQFPELLGFLKERVKDFLHQELERQWIVRVTSGGKNYYFPSSVIGAFFCFPSSKFANSLFLASLSREVEDIGSDPPFIQLKESYPDVDAVFLYLYMSSREARENYDRVGRMHLKKQTYREKEGKDVVRYAFKFPFPVSGEWELKARTVPVSDDSMLVVEIVYVNTRKLLRIDYLEVRRRGRRGAKKGRLLVFSSSSVRSKASVIYSTTRVVDKKEYPEAVSLKFLSPPAEKSVKVIKKVIYDDRGRFCAVPIPKKGGETKDLTNVEGASGRESGKPLRSRSAEVSPKDTENRVFDLETVKELMEHVALSLGINMKYREFTPQISIEARNRSKLYYPNGSRRKVGVFFSDLPSGKKMTAIFVDQKFQRSFITSPVLIGSRKLKFPEEVTSFLAEFMELDRKSFKKFCAERGFAVHLKKPLQGNSKKDWDNWVKVMVDVLEKKLR